jgi:type I restriction enzyme R subunit
VFIYSLKDGINDGFLTPFRVKQFASTLDEYLYTPDDKVVEGEVEAGKRYEEADFNRIIEIREREKARVRQCMAQIDQREKTLVFCATQDHALAIRDAINQIKTSSDPDFCQRVTANDGARGEQWLRDFQDNEKTIPTLLTTSQKLSTGVDARNVRNIVLLRPINSMIEFKQIIGRGTRLYDGKDYFTIYDFVKAHHHFNDPEWDGEPVEPENCKQCGCYPCVCFKEPPPPCYLCGNTPCTCPQEPCPDCSDIFDVLAYVAYAQEPLTREERAARAKAVIDAKFNSRQQAFLTFVLSHYVEEGVEELDQAKLTPLLKLRYHDSMKDALDDLGQPERIRRVFSGFQKYLYEERV